MTILDFSKASGPNYIPVVVLKNSQSEDLIVEDLIRAGKMCMAKTYPPVSLFSVVSKVFEKLVNNRLVDHLEKCGFFPDSQYGFRSCRSTVDVICI